MAPKAKQSIVRELDRLHLFLLSLAPYAYGLVIIVSIEVFLTAAYLVVSPKLTPYVPSPRLSAWVAGAAVFLLLVGMWGTALLERLP